MVNLTFNSRIFYKSLALRCVKGKLTKEDNGNHKNHMAIGKKKHITVFFRRSRITKDLKVLQIENNKKLIFDEIQH